MSTDETQEGFGPIPGQIDPAKTRRVGPYADVRFFAEGGMAWIFEARHPQLFDKRLAVKVLKPQFAADPAVRRRFLDEARYLVENPHPHLVGVHSFGLDQDSQCPYFAMEFIDGGTLAERIEASGPLSTAEAGELFDRVLSALASMHRTRWFHRDIKPSNFLLWRHGEPVLADLGIAKDELGSSSATTVHFIGTPKYSSPEQASGKKLDARTDVFSMGLSLFESLAGHHPYDDLDGVDTSSAPALFMLLGNLERSKKPITFEFPATVPKLVRAVIRKACEVEREKRYADAEEMRQALRGAIRAVEHRPEPLLGRSLRAARPILARHGRSIALGASGIVLAGALAIGGVSIWSGIELRRARATIAESRSALDMIAPRDAGAQSRIDAAERALERGRREEAVGIAIKLCSDLLERLAPKLGNEIHESSTLLTRATSAAAALPRDLGKWQKLQGLTNEAAAAPTAAPGERACASALQLEARRVELVDAHAAVEAGLRSPDLRQRVEVAMAESKARLSSVRVDADAAELTTLEASLADADRARGHDDLLTAFELYTRVDVGARSLTLARLEPRLREIADEPLFASRQPDARTLLAEIAQARKRDDPSARAKDFDLLLTRSNALLAAANTEINTAREAANSVLKRAHELGVPAAQTSRVQELMARAASEAEQQRIGPSLASTAEAQKLLEEAIARKLESDKADRSTAEGARDRATRARERALAGKVAPAVLEKADRSLRAAEGARAEGRFEVAARQFDESAVEFERVARVADELENKVQGQTTAARDGALRAQKAAQDARAPEVALRDANAELQTGEGALSRQEYAPAAEHFAAATRLFDRAAAAAGEAIGKAARERDAATAAEQSASDAGASAAELAPGADALHGGERALDRRDAIAASQAFASAIELFAKAKTSARSRGLEETATKAARRKASEVERRALGAKANDAELAAGRERLAAGDAALATNDSPTARRAFEAADALFRDVEKNAAGRQALERKARAVRDEASAAERSANDAKATTAELASGREAFRQGEAALAQTDFAVATARFVTAGDGFRSAETIAKSRVTHLPPAPMKPEPTPAALPHERPSVSATDDSHQALTVLDEYKAAYEAIDLARLETVWQMDPARHAATETFFGRVRRIQVRISGPEARREGSGVVLYFDQSITADGKPSPLVRMKAAVQRSGNRWVMTELGQAN